MIRSKGSRLLHQVAGCDIMSAFGTRQFASSAARFAAGRLNHVAIAVPDLQQAATRFRDVLGAEVSDPQPLPEHGVTVVFVSLPNAKIELLHPLGDASPIANFLAKNPAGGVHHICLEADDARAAMTHAATRVRVLDKEPKIGAHGTPVFFLHPKDMCGVLTEIEEVQR
jgi:methylmalonyl-CoA/ethylmalonyl-CoA epimerase